MREIEERIIQHLVVCGPSFPYGVARHFRNLGSDYKTLQNPSAVAIIMRSMAFRGLIEYVDIDAAVETRLEHKHRRRIWYKALQKYIYHQV